MKNLDDKKESVINQSKETLRSWVNKIGEKVGELESMLKPVLGQELPEKNPETGTPASDSPNTGSMLTLALIEAETKAYLEMMLAYWKLKNGQMVSKTPLAWFGDTTNDLCPILEPV